MTGWSELFNRNRRYVDNDGRVVDVREPANTPTALSAGTVVAVQPLTLEMADGSVAVAGGYLRTAGRPPLGAEVVVLRRGSVLIVLGEVVLL